VYVIEDTGHKDEKGMMILQLLEVNVPYSHRHVIIYELCMILRK
jgi:hypothetical protein